MWLKPFMKKQIIERIIENNGRIIAENEKVLKAEFFYSEAVASDSDPKRIPSINRDKGPDVSDAFIRKVEPVFFRRKIDQPLCVQLIEFPGNVVIGHR